MRFTSTNSSIYIGYAAKIMIILDNVALALYSIQGYVWLN